MAPLEADGRHPDPHDLDRFVAAQDAGGTYERALGELRAGRKTSHWMWFVLPQLAGLGRSSTAVHYALPDLAAARAYLAHPVLGPRLRTCVEVLLTAPSRDATAVLGDVDAAKLRSCATLFARAVGAEGAEFRVLLEEFFGGAADPATSRLLQDGGDRNSASA